MYPSPLRGLILAGGKSIRMGIDKGLIKVDGVMQKDRLYPMMAGHCNEVYFSCRGNAGNYQPYPTLVDRTDFEGPMAGLASAFAVYPDSAWLAVGIDMVGVTEETLAFLIRSRKTGPVATCFVNPKDSREEPMLAIWEKSVLPLITSYANKGNFSLMGLLQSEQVNRIPCPNLSWLVNQNYAGPGSPRPATG